MPSAPRHRRPPPVPDALVCCRWARVPEFGCAATAVSLLMPHAEPYVVASARHALTTLEAGPGQGGTADPERTAALATSARAYIRQEAAHHGQHRRFNDAVARRYRGVGTLDRWMASTFARLERRGPRAGIAYAAGFEAVAFAAARWAERHREELFRGADPAATDLFLWHLAEEVEHKSVAHDLHVATGGTRRDYAAGLVLGFAVLVWFTFLGTVVLLAGERRLFHPLAWIRLLRWGFGFAFDVLPTLVVTLGRDHHPDRLADPLWLRSWLAERDLAEGPSTAGGATGQPAGRSAGRSAGAVAPTAAPTAATTAAREPSAASAA